MKWSVMIMSAAAFTIAGCEERSPIEEVGDSVRDGIEDAREGIEDAAEEVEEAAEEVGEAIEDAADEVRDR
jgi:hypothetical protein